MTLETTAQYVAGRGRWGRGDDDARASIGIGYAF